MSKYTTDYGETFTVNFDNITEDDYISITDYNVAPGNYTFTTTGTTTFTYPTMEDMQNMKKDIEDIKRRLAILDDPSPEKLEKHKMLKEAYNKYKMIEALIGEKD